MPAVTPTAASRNMSAMVYFHLQPHMDGADDEDESALDAELAALRDGIAAARRGLAAGRAELRVLDRDLAAAGTL